MHLYISILQKLYNLSVSDMINGDYLGFKGPSLTSLDAFEIGLHALEGTVAAFIYFTVNGCAFFVNFMINFYITS